MMANRDCIFKHSFELKRAQKIGQTTEGVLKTAKDAFDAEVKRCADSENKATKSSLEVTTARERMAEVV